MVADHRLLPLTVPTTSSGSVACMVKSCLGRDSSVRRAPVVVAAAAAGLLAAAEVLAAAAAAAGLLAAAEVLAAAVGPK